MSCRTKMYLIVTTPLRTWSHGHLDSAVDEPDVRGPRGEESDDHADLHQEPVGGRAGQQMVRRREVHERHQRHPAKEADLEAGQGDEIRLRGGYESVLEAEAPHRRDREV